MQVKKNLVSIKMFLFALKQIKLPGRSERDGMQPDRAIQSRVSAMPILCRPMMVPGGWSFTVTAVLGEPIISWAGRHAWLLFPGLKTDGLL